MSISDFYEFTIKTLLNQTINIKQNVFLKGLAYCSLTRIKHTFDRSLKLPGRVRSNSSDS